jgi:hypothetical protein
MSGSSSPSGETKYNWNEDMGPRWNNLLNTAPWALGMVGSNGQLQIPERAQYTGERHAPIAYDQYAAGSNIRSLNERSTGTIEAGNAARGQITNTLGGGYLGENGGNPYMGLNPAAGNPYVGGNQYMGESPAFNSMMGDVMGDMASGYQQGTSAETTRLFNHAGAFGGSAHQNAVMNNQAALAKGMGQTANQMRSQQFDRSAGLKEAELGRGFQNYNAGLDRGMQGWEGERGRMMQASGLGQNEQGLALNRAGAQMGVGEMYQQQGQKERDFLFDQWNQNQQHPFQLMDWLSGLYGRAQGGMAPNSQVYSSGASSAAPYAGAALGLASLFG